MIRRSRIRYKRKVKSISWRSGRVREDAIGMARLRAAAYERSRGMCECNRNVCLQRPVRLQRVNWPDGHLHHVIPRGRGGSDVLDNVQFITALCHSEITGTPEWSFKKRRVGE
jgi:hypothetical protein